jgi:hypothetical protein
VNVPARRLRIAVLAVVGLVALYGVVGGLIVPPLAKKLLAEKLGDRLGRIVVVDSVSVNPYTLDATLKGFRILEADGKTAFASFDVLDVNGSAASIYRLAPVIDELTLSGLKVNVVRDGESHYNLSDILKRLTPAARAASKDEQKEQPARFSVGNIRVVNAAVDFDDRPKGAKHRVSEMQITIPFISNLPTHLKDQVQPSFSANINGTPLKLTGEALPFENTVRTHFNLDIRALDVPRYLGYLPADLPVKVDSGKLDARISLRFTQAPGKDPAVDVAGTAALDNVSLSTGDGPLGKFARLEADIASLDPIGGVVKVTSVRLAGASAMQDQWKIPSVEARDIGVDLKKHAVRVASLATGDGALTVKRNRDGSIDLPRIPPSEHPTKWDVEVEKLALSGYKITVLDSTVKPAATHRIVLASLEAEGLSTDNGFKGNATAKVRLDKGGTLDASSTFALEPLAVKATVDARSIDLVPLRAYVSQFSTVALKSGAASAKGTVSLQGQGDAMRIGYAGAAEIANLATLDTVNKEDLLNWKSVKASAIKLDYAANAPLDLAVAEIVVDKAYSRIVVTPEGKLNVQQLRTATPAEAEPPPPAAPPKPRNVRIDRITFVDSRLNFTDHFIKPNYTADVGELQGSVTNLSSEPASRAAVDLNGRWDSASPVLIAGTVNPLRGDLFLDIAAKGQDIELTKLTAYSQRYAGYGITDGRLTLDVKYHIENGKMEGRNKIVIDQLTFGDKVESPEATKLPVLFAVNLLKDSKGRIDLELPITGSLEDPKFEIGALIGQVVSNLFKKAATSPFSLIAAAAGGGGKEGGGEDLAFVEFDPGQGELTPAAEKKLETLVKVLQDRPGLKIEIASRIDPEKDVDALKAAARERKLAAAPKDLSKEAKEKLMQEPVEVGEEELRALSAKRAERVKAYLVASGRLPPERVLVASGPAQAQEGSKARLSRVDFALK